MPSKITQLECLILLGFLDQLIEHCEQALSALRQTKPSERSDTLRASIEYWRHCRSAFRWAKSQANQRTNWGTNGQVSKSNDSIDTRRSTS